MRWPVFKSCIRSPALDTASAAVTDTRDGKTLLLRSSFGDTTSNDVGDDVAWLNPCEEQLGDFSQAAHGIKIGLSKSTDANTV